MTTEEPTSFPIKALPGSVHQTQRSQLITAHWLTDQAFCTQNLQLTGSPAIPRDSEWAPTLHMCTPALLLALLFPLPQKLTEGPLLAGSCRAEWGALDVLSRGLGLKELIRFRGPLSPLKCSLCTCKGEALPDRRKSRRHPACGPQAAEPEHQSPHTWPSELLNGWRDPIFQANDLE